MPKPHKLLSQLKQLYIENPALESNTGEDESIRWAAVRYPASIRVCVDFLNGKCQEFQIELPAGV